MCKHRWYRIHDIDGEPLYFCIGCRKTINHTELQKLEKNIRYYVDNIGPDDVSWCDPFPPRIGR